MGLGTPLRLHCPGEKSPFTLLFIHLGLLNPCFLGNSAAASISPVLNYVLHLSDAGYREVPLQLPQWNPSEWCHPPPASAVQFSSSYCADGPSLIILPMFVGQFNKKRKVRQGISNKRTMTGLGWASWGEKPNQNTKTNQKITRNMVLQIQAQRAEVIMMTFLSRWWNHVKSIFEGEIKTGKERQKIFTWRKQASSPPF